MSAGQSRSAEVPAQATASPAPTETSDELDDQVLRLREEGRSFANIARQLGLEGALQANAAFNRALRRQPEAEQESVRNHEMVRLDDLAERLRQRPDLDEVQLARRMRNLEQLRRTVLSA